MDVRVRHRGSERSAGEIPNIVSYLLKDYGFAAGRHLCHVLKLCCLVLDRHALESPVVDINLSGCAGPPVVFSSAVSCVQSYVKSPCCKQIAFVTQATLDAVCDALTGSQAFMSNATFDPWAAICTGDCVAFVSRYSLLFDNYLAEKKKKSRC